MPVHRRSANTQSGDGVDLGFFFGAKMATQQQRKEAMREIIDRTPFGALMSLEDTQAANAIAGWDYPFIKHIKNPAYPKDTRCICVSRDGVNFEAHSWAKAIDGGNKRKKDLTFAMRASVAYQLQDYMAKQHNPTCAMCSTTIGLTVDHQSPTFKQISDKFLSDQEAPVQICNSGDGAGWAIAAEAVDRQWKQFHALASTYQILCRSCNSKKGQKHG